MTATATEGNGGGGRLIEQPFALHLDLDKGLYRKLPSGNLLLKLAVSDESPDLEGHVTRASGFRESLPYLERWGTVNWDHGKGPGDILGEVRKAEITTSPISGLPALLAEVELYRHCPGTRAIQRILDSGGKIGASIQGKILKQVPGMHRGRPIKENVKCFAAAVALTRAPINPACELLELSKSFAEAVPQEVEREREDWFARVMGEAIQHSQEALKALTAGEGICVEGMGGGAALRKQSLEGAPKRMTFDDIRIVCPACGTKNPGTAKKCTSCTEDLTEIKRQALQKAQAALFGDGEDRWKGWTNEPPVLPEKQQQKGHPGDVQHSLFEETGHRATEHDKWHEWASGHLGKPVRQEHHNLPALVGLYGRADAGRQSFHRAHIAHIAEYHPHLLDAYPDVAGRAREIAAQKDTGPPRRSLGKGMIAAQTPDGVMVQVFVGQLRPRPRLVLRPGAPATQEKEQDDDGAAIEDLPGEDLKKAPDDALKDLLHGMKGMSAEDHERHIGAHARQADDMAKVAKRAGLHFQQGEGMTGYVGKHVPSWNILQDHIKQHTWERDRLQQGPASRKLHETRSTGQLTFAALGKSHKRATHDRARPRYARLGNALVRVVARGESRRG